MADALGLLQPRVESASLEAPSFEGTSLPELEAVKTVMINRSPVMMLWLAVVALLRGYDWGVRDHFSRTQV